MLMNCVCFAYADNTEEQLIEYYPDGSYYIVTISSHTSFTSFLQTRGTKTETKNGSHYNSNGSIAWKASITATFTYNGTSASCTDVSKSTTIYDSAWKCTSSSCSKSGATATGNFTFKRYVLLVPVQTVNKTLTLTCDKNGNVS